MPPIAPDDPPRLHDLMAAVGYFLLRWGNLERDLDGAPTPAELDGVRVLRNLVCHTIEAATSDLASGVEPRLRCRDAKGQPVEVTYTELQDAIRTLERFRGRGPGVLEAAKPG